jgi:hypothetical protein
MTQPPGPPFLPGEPGYPQQPDQQPPFPPYSVPVQPTPGYPTSAPPGYPTSAPPGYPTSAPPGFPTSAPPGYQFPTSAPPGAYQWGPPAPPPKKKRGVLIAVLVAAAVVLVCGGAGVGIFLATQNNSGGKGQASAVEAVQGFLTAVYQDMDATKAATYVCKTSRDKAKLTKKINEIRTQNATYDTPKYTWDTPTTAETKTNQAVLSTTLTLTTANEQTAVQKLRFVATKNNGWWVCEVTQTS